MKNSKILGIVVMLVLVAALAFVIVVARPNAGTGAVTQSTAQGMSSEGFSSEAEMMAAHHPEQAKASSGGMSSEGFSSYEEMMAAHHPAGGSGASDGPGCGGVAGTGENPYAGQTSDYGLSYDDAGYQKLLGDAKSITLNAEQTKLIVGLNIEIPCCGVKTLQASGNCECGHHQAMFGLAKRLASNGYNGEQIQSELNKWKQVFYPAGAGGSTGGC